MSAPAKILELVKRFDDEDSPRCIGRRDNRRRCQQFVNPFFKSLGWDMDNEEGAAEAYKDVIHEAAIKIGGATKAPASACRHHKSGESARTFRETKMADKGKELRA